MAKIYVASSWRNQYFPEVVRALREAGHEVYDFRNPPHGGNGLSACGAFPPSRSEEGTSTFSSHSGVGFKWTYIDENAPNWTFAEYSAGLHHPKAERQFKADMEALEWADTCVLVLPCGRSAHTEAGWMAGAGRRVVAYIPEMVEPELMYKLFDSVVGTLEDLLRAV